MNYFNERNEVVENYALALFEVAKESNEDLFEIIKDLEHFELALQSNESSNLKKLLYHPLISVEEKIDALHNVFDDALEQLVVEFIVSLTEEQRLTFLHLILEEFKAIVRKDQNVISVKAKFGFEPTLSDIENITSTMKEKLSANEVDFEYIVDEDLIGGVKLFFNGKLVDNTLTAKINRYAKQIKS